MRIGVTFLSFLILLFSLLIVPQSATAQAPASDQSPGTNHPGTVNKSFNEGMGGVIIKVNELESKISEKRNDVREKVRLKLLTDSFLKTQDAVNKAYTDAKSVNCKSDSAKLNATFEEVYKTVGYWWAMSQEIQRVEGRVLNPFLSNSWWAAPPERKCEILQDENIHQSAIKAYNDAEASSKKYGQEIEVLSRELSDLYASRDKISGSQTAIKNVTENLPWMLGIIAAFALVIMGIVYLYEPDIQMEWVASGQITQFATVMILLSTLMALGLTDVLHEQVLGTLLGGVAGYVLAQGVGRATARATLNAAAAATPPGSPPAPPPAATPPGPPPAPPPAATPPRSPPTPPPA